MNEEVSRSRKSAATDRVISLGPSLAAIPERLLLAHAQGKVLFIVGAGVSRSSGLPDFRGLALNVYEQLDPKLHKCIASIPKNACNQWGVDLADLKSDQAAEVRRFSAGEYDVALGMLERRTEDLAHVGSRVRQEIAQVLRNPAIKPAPIHKALVRLADRGGALTIITTNFELLLEEDRKSVV